MDAPHELAFVPPNCRLPPPLVILPEQLPLPVLLASKVLVMLAEPELLKMPPPSPVVARLPEKVLFVTVRLLEPVL